MFGKFTLAKDRRTGGGSQQDVDTADRVVPQRSPAVLRMLHDVQELSVPECASVKFDDPDDLLHYKIHLSPSEGYYQDIKFTFDVQVGANYPITPPKVKCVNKVFHPNIDAEGNVCLNILRSEWRPVLNINSLVYGLLHLLYEPSYEDALNPQAANILRCDPTSFGMIVKTAMSFEKGGGGSKSK